jgi:hypothetical protein
MENKNKLAMQNIHFAFREKAIINFVAGKNIPISTQADNA